MTSLRKAVDADDWSLGPVTAPVTLVEYGDFECPHCGRAYWVLQRLRRALGGDLRLVFRSFPLQQPQRNERIQEVEGRAGVKVEPLPDRRRREGAVVEQREQVELHRREQRLAAPEAECQVHDSLHGRTLAP